jgi:DNA-binding response OmpR family regulator
MHVKDMLPTGNFEVIEAKDGLEGYNLILSEQPNLILLDFILPKMNGWEVYQELQKQYSLKSIPLVIMSGRKEEVVDKIPEPFEFFTFIQKPFDQKQLITAIKEAMVKAKKHRQPTEPQVAVVPSSLSEGDPSAMAAEIKALKQKVHQMQTEIDSLKKQLHQLVSFIRKKLT